jgi:hypothetical protein
MLTGLWCNGNTTDFDSVFLGSNPSNPTLQDKLDLFPFVLFLFSLEPSTTLYIIMTSFILVVRSINL